MKVATKAKKILRKVSSHVPKNKKAVAKGVNRYVTKNPYKMMGISAVTGLCVGFLMHRH